MFVFNDEYCKNMPIDDLKNDNVVYNESTINRLRGLQYVYIIKALYICGTINDK